MGERKGGKNAFHRYLLNARSLYIHYHIFRRAAKRALSGEQGEQRRRKTKKERKNAVEGKVKKIPTRCISVRGGGERVKRTVKSEREGARAPESGVRQSQRMGIGSTWSLSSINERVSRFSANRRAVLVASTSVCNVAKRATGRGLVYAPPPIGARRSFVLHVNVAINRCRAPRGAAPRNIFFSILK